MDKFVIDTNNQRIVRFRDDMPQNVSYDESFVQYSIPLSDVPNLVSVLKSSGNIKEDAKQGSTTNTTAVKADDPIDSLYAIINKQASIIDRQLVLVENAINK